MFGTTSSNIPAMNTTRIFFASIVTLLSLSLTSCDPAYIGYGYPGRDGRAFFGINYDYAHPYSYWDNNPSVPDNPAIGHYYPTFPGLYEFEYFINSVDYWYGTYEIWINPGGPGGPNGMPGIDGMDNYLMLICNPDGFYFHDFNSYKTLHPGKDSLVIETEHYRITLRKATIHERTPVRDIPPYTVLVTD